MFSEMFEQNFVIPIYNIYSITFFDFNKADRKSIYRFRSGIINLLLTYTLIIISFYSHFYSKTP